MEKYIQIGDDGKHSTRSIFYLQYLGLRKVLINFVFAVRHIYVCDGHGCAEVATFSCLFFSRSTFNHALT